MKINKIITMWRTEKCREDEKWEMQRNEYYYVSINVE